MADEALYLWVMLNLADYVTTRVALTRGGRELNPLFRWIYKRFGFFMMWVAKFLIVAILPLIAWLSGADIELTLWIWNAILGLVVANNSFQIYRITRGDRRG